MILKHSNDISAEVMKKPGFTEMNARFLLTSQDGCPRYAMRLMEFGPGGCTSYHCHQEEHEMFFLEGKGVVVGEEKKEIPVRAGDALFILPGEYHQIKNTGKDILKMICTVPIFPGKTGIDTTPCE
jgi:quercetin dioxygenase-like cupin family protein